MVESVKQPIFYVTRKYPPTVGGMELHAYRMHNILKSKFRVEALVNDKKSFIHLAWFLPLVTWKTFTTKADTIVAADILVAFFANPKKKIIVFLHGLDTVYPNPLYNWMRKRVYNKSSIIVANSPATGTNAIVGGANDAKMRTIPPGVDDSLYHAKANGDKQTIIKELGINKDSILLLTAGRLVERKGVRWFINNVMPLLPENYHYLVAGTGPEQSKIVETASSKKLKNRVHMLGNITGDKRVLYMQKSDFFVIPNIPKPNNMEGFGLVAPEAALAGTYVVANNLEGLSYAIADGQTGTLVNNIEEWVSTLTVDIASIEKRSLDAKEKAFELYNNNQITSLTLQALESS